MNCDTTLINRKKQKGKGKKTIISVQKMWQYFLIKKNVCSLQLIRRNLKIMTEDYHVVSNVVWEQDKIEMK